jgi:CHASE1-domain containing sensor protein
MVVSIPQSGDQSQQISGKTVKMARKLVVHNNDWTLIVAPLKELAEKHLTMGRNDKNR